MGKANENWFSTILKELGVLKGDQWKNFENLIQGISVGTFNLMRSEEEYYIFTFYRKNNKTLVSEFLG